MPRTRRQPLRKGELVRIRSREEILASLDPDGNLDGLPFMPEMLQFAGTEITVQARADKTCDTINLTGTSRQLENTVHLTGLRCDGSAHGGCQAGCLLFWREEWLARPGDPAQPAAPPSSVTEKTLHAGTGSTGDDGKPLYRCQATELLRASRHLSGFDLRQYVRDVRYRNVGFWTLLAGLAVTAFNKLQRASQRLPRWLPRYRGGQLYPFFRGTGDGSRTPALKLAPGDLVQVRDKLEIEATLDAGNTNRGMWFDYEMVPYCGARARVARSVTKIINESTGKMMKLSDCVVLDGVICTGRYRRFCQRAITPYWRSAWLRRLDQEPGSKAAEPDQKAGGQH